MAKYQLKTRASDKDVGAYIDSLEPAQRRKDCRELCDIMARLSAAPPKMWGDSIIGFGRYDYKYASGHEGSYFQIGFAPRKAALTLYIMPGYRDISQLCARLGKHKISGKSCMQIKTLDDIDRNVLEDILRYALTYLREHYATAS